MFAPATIERAVELQKRSYALLRWATDAIERGFIRFDTLHTYATLPAAAAGWIESHHNDLPKTARPSLEDLRDFANLFSTYLESSFDLVENPGERLHSPSNHCFCPMCSWLVEMPRLQTKKISRHDKERARRLQVDAIGKRAAEQSRVLPDGFADRLVEDPEMRETLGLVAYGDDLFRRIAGTSEGPATLALWRRFAWTPQGSPKQNFALTSAMILTAEQALVASFPR